MKMIIIIVAKFGKLCLTQAPIKCQIIHQNTLVQILLWKMSNYNSS